MDLDQLADLHRASERLQALWTKRDNFGFSAEDDTEVLELAHRLMPVIERFGQFAEMMMATIRTAYAEAGKPLGDDDKAMWQWTRDQAAADRARLDAVKEASWQFTR